MEKLLELIRKQSEKALPVNRSTSIGTVTEITGVTCTVEREDLPPLYDVRLNAIDKNFDDCILIYPAIGSEVLCLVVENEPAETAIVKYTKIDKVLITLGGARFEMSGGKFELKNQESNLKEILTEGFDNLKNAVITTPSGPGQFSDINKQKFEELKNKTTQLFQ
ncbi:hypothetical protein EGI16_21625 [Chryseobacterium sp. G0240]|uniref:hypothetical protein n=1 Tax=Chryseobacterium sp. G0240 TaxID=2487066 RepID=UPI000F454C9D|nr:hypothetical protein [Chryseobacterium sp. G0240]ROH98280.1 hypothetical protein EGI16_21625 [Chryseobacterium sp. G0240]